MSEMLASIQNNKLNRDSSSIRICFEFRDFAIEVCFVAYSYVFVWVPF